MSIIFAGGMAATLSVCATVSDDAQRSNKDEEERCRYSHRDVSEKGMTSA